MPDLAHSANPHSYTPHSAAHGHTRTHPPAPHTHTGTPNPGRRRRPLPPAHSRELVEVSVPFIPSPFRIALHEQARAAHPDLVIPSIHRRPLLLRCATPLPLNPAHLTSRRCLVPLPSVRVGPQWTPAAGHPLYEVRSVLGARRAGDPSAAARRGAECQRRAASRSSSMSR